MSTLSPARPGPSGGHRSEAPPAASVEATTATGSRSGFRADIQGLRAVAVTLVVLYHCDVVFLSGGYVGVDVFFVISGFLITGHLIGEVERTGRVALLGFWARRIRRLLPPALLVVATTVVAARLWGPVLDSTRTAREGVLATFYAMNYHLAGQGIDYQQADATPSPLQHFWSLAVEEQFYLIWPVVVLVVALLLRRAPHGVRRAALLLVVIVVVAVSLRESMLLTVDNPPLAYFSLQTRAWELGVGAAVALVAPLLAHRRLPRAPAAALAWVGLLAVVASAVVYDESTPFPGLYALVPVLGAALVIAGGCSRPSGGVERVLDNRPTQLVGNVSYGWYLWHWPLIILGPALWGFSFGTLEKLEMSFIGLWLAIGSYLLVERPVLRRTVPLKRVFALGLVSSLATAGVAGAALAAGPSIQGSGARSAAASASDQTELVTDLRRALTVDEVPSNLEPSLAAADADVPQTSLDGCHVDLLVTEQAPCVYGDTKADKTIVLFGDSHAEQWFTALDLYAEQRGYRLVSWTKVACPLADVTIANEQLGRDYTECDEWRSQRMQAIAQLRPDVVVAGQADSLVPYDFDDDRWARATARTLRTLADDTDDTGDLVLLSDIARASQSVPTCLSSHLDDAQACDVASDEGLLGTDGTYSHLPARHRAVQQATEVVDLARIDTQSLTCVGEVCPPVVGRTLVYRDDAHLTQFYVRSIAPVLAGALDSVLAGPASGKDTP